MFEVSITKTFSAAHSLKEIGGRCEGLHGHNYRVQVVVASEDLNNEGLVMDFRLIKKITEGALDNLDHKHLNDLTCFHGRNPSAENIARLIYDLVAGELSGKDPRVARVTVWESDDACASFRP